MNIRKLFPHFNVPIIFRDLNDSAGQYWVKSDCVVLDNNLKKTLPGYAKLVLLHEMIHSTASKKRLLRWDRLVNNFGPYVEGSLSYRMEECIAEIGCMVAAIKLGLFNEYSRTVILSGLEKNYTKDMYIPIREIRAAVRYYADEDTSFEDEIEQARIYLEAYMDIKFQDSYNTEKTA